MVPNLPKETLMFDSFFESGNLDLVVKQKDNEYDLYMRSDSNTRGHHQWFYFSVSNSNPVTAKFNILNFTKRGSSLRARNAYCNLFGEKNWEGSERRASFFL